MHLQRKENIEYSAKDALRLLKRRKSKSAGLAYDCWVIDYATDHEYGMKSYVLIYSLLGFLNPIFPDKNKAAFLKLSTELRRACVSKSTKLPLFTQPLGTSCVMLSALYYYIHHSSVAKFADFCSKSRNKDLKAQRV